MITHTQRVKAALEGKMLDRPAFAAWGPHMNLVDRNAKDFARATIDYQNAHHFDFIKVMPNGMYFPEAFGQKLKDADFILDETWQNVQVNAINDPHEWAKLKVPSMKEGVFAREIEAVKRIADYFQGSEALHLIVNVQAGGQTAEVELKNAHTHIVRIEKNGESVFRAEEDGTQDGFTDHSCLTVEKIVDFANTCDLADIEPTLQKQIDCNMQIAEEGLNNRWGVNVGKLYYENGKLLQAYAAAASDARMSGCNLPVVIVSGSGNQGATASLPVIVYAEKHGCSREQMLRALALSDLIAIHLKSGIGRLSAYCGAVCAATGAGCAMTYLDGGTLEQIDQTITNSIATSSGMVCDGAKPSCAAKIATSLESAIMAHDLAMANRAFQSGEGIVMDNVEQTIDAVGCVASQGMHITDQVILNLMTQQKGARA